MHPLYLHCRRHTDERVARLRAAIASVRQAREADTKSSAGDKFETGRERLQAEEDKLTAQLEEVLRGRRVLAILENPPAGEPGRARLGSLVETDRGNFYLSVAAGRADWDGSSWFCVSPGSPVGRALNGCRAGDRLRQGEREIIVRSVS